MQGNQKRCWKYAALSSSCTLNSEVFTTTYALCLKKLRLMHTLVPGQGENSSPETKHHDDFTDFLHWFPAATQKCVFHHSLAGAAPDPSFTSDCCSSAPGMVQSQGTVLVLECLWCLFKCQLSQIWRAFSSSASLFLSQRSKMHEDLHPLTFVSNLDHRLLLLHSQLLKIDGSWEITRLD